MICTEKYYGQRHNRSAVLADFTFHIGLVKDLVLELTKAANLVCRRVRETIVWFQ